MPVKTRKKFKPVERFLISQFTFPTTVTGYGWVKKILSGVPALKNKDCRRFFFGQLISNIGSWMQVVALGWLVFSITNSAFWVGVVAAASSIPALFFSLLGGSIVDNFSKKKVLMASHIAAMVLAFVLGGLTLSNHINLVVIIIISLLGGIINSIYTPAHFSFISEIAEKEILTSAMAINASVSSLGRIIGPIFAGLYIKVAGTGGAFLLNGLSYFAVIFALILIKSSAKTKNNHLNPIKAIKEGLTYSIKNPMIRSVIIYVAATSIFAWPYSTILPVVAKNIFHTDAVGLGYFYTAIGLGSITATVIAASISGKLSKLTLILFGNTAFAISIFLFSFTTNLTLGLIYMFFSGLGLVLINVVLGTMIQQMADPQYRGRVSSIYFLVYGGILFLGNLEIGYLTEKLGSQLALRLNTFLIISIGIYIFFIRHKLRQSQRKYNNIHHIK